LQSNTPPLARPRCHGAGAPEGGCLVLRQGPGHGRDPGAAAHDEQQAHRHEPHRAADRSHLQQAGDPAVVAATAAATGLVDEGAGDEALAGAGGAGHEDLLVLGDPDVGDRRGAQ